LTICQLEEAHQAPKNYLAEGLQSWNFGVHTAWRKARDMDVWHQVTHQYGNAPLWRLPLKKMKIMKPTKPQFTWKMAIKMVYMSKVSIIIIIIIIIIADDEDLQRS